MDQPPTRTIFFAVFEPSGDVLAARLIAELKHRDPSLRFVGFGGPAMAGQGVELLETTTEHAAIMLGAVGQVQAHRARLKRLDGYLAKNDIAALVPVDSPAANWSVCKRVRRHRPSARIVHLVCPQVWGWATWRVRRLRNLTDKVLCLLPFEPGWLADRGVPGVFVGHPVFDDAQEILGAPIDSGLPATDDPDAVKLALMPGSRRSEFERNWPTMLEVFSSLKHGRPGLVGVVAVREPENADVLRQVSGNAPWPDGLTVVAGRTPAVLRWADLALVKSGTSTLQVASLRRPMVAFYNVSAVAWQALGRWLIKSRTFALPNLLSEWQSKTRVVPEFIPHFADPGPIADALAGLIDDAPARAAQRTGLDRIAEPFASVHFGHRAADELLSAMSEPKNGSTAS